MLPVNLKRHLLETATLVAAAVLCALVSNALAPRDGKLALVGSYPNATTVPTPAPTAGPVRNAIPEDSSKGKKENDPMPAPAPTAKGGDVAVAEGSSKVKREPAGSARPGSTSGPIAAASPPPSLPFSEKSAPAAASPPATGRLSPSDLLERFPPHPDKPSVEVSGDDVALLHASRALVLDARRTKVYEEGHIAGAKSVSVWEGDVDTKVLALLNEGRDLAAPVVLYCSGGDCEDSHLLAQKLFGAGFNNVRVYKDGWPDWQKRHGASATGPEK
jgi:rhodanese-related sulfurtransferase